MKRHFVLYGRCIALLIVASAAALPSAVQAQKRGLVGALLGAGAGAAAAAARPGSEAVKTYGPNDLRPEALTTCMIAAYRIDEGEAPLDRLAPNLKSESAAIDKDQAALARDGKKEFTEQADADNYNARLRVHKARVAAFNSKIESYNERRAALKKETEVFNGQCANKRYFTSDLVAIQGKLPFDPAKYSGASVAAPPSQGGSAAPGSPDYQPGRPPPPATSRSAAK